MEVEPRSYSWEPQSPAPESVGSRRRSHERHGMLNQSSPIQTRSRRNRRSLGSEASGGSKDEPISPFPPTQKQRRGSLDSIGSLGSQGSLESHGSLERWLSEQKQTNRRSLKEFAQSQMMMRDESEVLSVAMIASACLVATCCGIAAFCLHQAVQFAGCLGGVNGCKSSILYDQLEPLGISKSVYFIVSSALSGLIASLIIHSSFAGGIAKKCKGGGTAGTKILISAGKRASSWIAFFRIVLAAIYMGGGNTLGTEGPIIHLSTALATTLTGLSGAKRRKVLSIFGVIGASAGISAGFNVLITGFIYTIEELTRTLSRKVALILTLASAVAIYVKDSLEHWLEHWYHIEHASLMPDREIWTELTPGDISQCLLLSIPIGILNGVAGWVFTRLAYKAQNFLNDHASGKSKFYLPARLHLAVIGLITGSLGAIAYEVTGVNGVWGTTISAIPDSIANTNITWDKALLLFVMKFLSFILATAGGGPGGLLVPSLVAGGFMGLTIGLLSGGNEALVSACSVIGMGSLFSSVLHLPVSGIIIVFELTRAEALVLHVVLANFISSNVAVRLPGGEHSFVHLNLEHDPTWLKLGGQDFIETDQQEHNADTTIGQRRLYSMKTWALKDFFMTDRQRLTLFFEGWADWVETMTETRGVRKHDISLTDVKVNVKSDSWDGPVVRELFLQQIVLLWRGESFESLRASFKNREKHRIAEGSHTLSQKLIDDVVGAYVLQKSSAEVQLPTVCQGDPGLRPSFDENVFEHRIATKESVCQGDPGLRPSFDENVFEHRIPRNGVDKGRLLQNAALPRRPSAASADITDSSPTKMCQFPVGHARHQTVPAMPEDQAQWMDRLVGS